MQADDKGAAKVSFFARARQRMETVAESLDQHTSKLFAPRNRVPRCQVRMMRTKLPQ